MDRADLSLKAGLGVFRSIWRGQKTAELRKDDRGFQVGDRIRIYEWDSVGKQWKPPHRQVLVEVTHITRVEDWVKTHDATHYWVVLSFKVIKKKQYDWKDSKTCSGCKGELK